LVRTKEVPLTPPEALLTSPCKPLNGFTTPLEQGLLFVDNYKCIEKYELKLQSFRDWKKETEAIYSDNPNAKNNKK
jgi:hypothetical protein